MADPTHEPANGPSFYARTGWQDRVPRAQGIEQHNMAAHIPGPTYLVLVPADTVTWASTAGPR